MEIQQKYVGIGLMILGVVLIIILIGLKANFDSEAVFLCEVVAENPNLDMSECPAHESNTSWFIVTGFIVSSLLLGLGIYLLIVTKVNKPVKEECKKSFKKIDLSKLDEDENKIYDLLKQNEGSLYQSDLIKQTQYSKVKISRILDKMQTKDIIDRKRRGMTNIIVLK